MRVKRLFQSKFLRYWQIGLVVVETWLLTSCNFPASEKALPTCLPEELTSPAIPMGPRDGEVIDNLSPTYIWVWEGGCNPQEFLLEVFNPSSDLPAMISVRVAGSSRGRASAGDLQPGNTYSWRVTPYTDGSPGPVSQANIFMTGPDCMDAFAAEYPAPILLAPPNGTEISELNPIHSSDGGVYPSVSIRMVWDDPFVCNPGGYQLQVSTSPAFPDSMSLDFPQDNRTAVLFFFPPGVEEGLTFQDCTLYYWHVRALLPDDEYGPWSEIWTFFINTGSLLCTTRPVVTLEIPIVQPPSLPTSLPPMASGIHNTNCRSGPSRAFSIASTLFEGQSARIIGRTEDSNWWLIEDRVATHGCWVWEGAVEVSGDVSLVPLVPSPPTLEAPSLPQQEEQQRQQAGCWIIDNQHPNGYCAPRACGPKDYPGGSCTP